nr:integrase, catalytic region, zinc finger, CCHC-type, peptidase aspartic, catalytic [Tanacetum cinerariifolium]
MTEDRSQLINFVQKFLGTVKFGNDHVVKIIGYGDYQIGNVMISQVYYMEGLGHNLFSVRQFCDSDLDVAFCQHTCFIRNLEGVDLLTGVALVSSASGSQSQDNTKKNRIRRTQKKAKETELEDHLRNVKSSLNKASVVDSRATHM